MYVKGNIDCATKVFDKMPERHMGVWSMDSCDYKICTNELSRAGYSIVVCEQIFGQAVDLGHTSDSSDSSA